MSLVFQNINDFLNKKWTKKKLIVIYGPTASWKTNLSIKIAKFLNSEIISADSRQIFKYLNIWTWKVTEEEMRWIWILDECNNKTLIPHYMIDFLEPDEEYSVWAYKKEAEICLEKIYNKWKIPILCWWTGLYIDSLIYNFKIPKVPWDKKLRDELEKERLEKWNDYIWQKLNEIDPEYAKELHSNNYRYVIRGIEVKMLTWKSKLDFREKKELKYDVLFLTPYNWDRKNLYEKIDTRVQKMFDDWLVEEVKPLLKKYWKDAFWMKTIGYREVIEYLEWNISLDECIELVKKWNRNYAKRQLTWFRKYTM
jgi:tRNA dimethylallyltransferase